MKNMVKVMFADDEYYIRQGLKNAEMWQQTDVELLEAEDGIQAWELYQRERPQILVLDINMPGMTGIELAQKIRETDELSRIVFLTGYDDFHLIKSAVSLQATDYLLKPVVSEELQQAIDKAMDFLKRQSTQLQYMDKLRRQVKDFGHAARDQLLLDLIQQRRRTEDCLESLAQTGIAFPPGSRFAVMCAEVDDGGEFMREVPPREQHLRHYLFRKLAEEAVESYPGIHVIQVYPTRLLMLVVRGESERPDLLEAAGRLNQIFQTLLKISVSVGIGRWVEHPEQICLSYQEAWKAMEFRELVGRGKILSYDMLNFDKPVNQKLLDKELYLLSEMRAGNVEKVMEVLAGWSRELAGLSFEEVKLIVSQIVIFVMRLLKENGFSENQTAYPNPLVDMAYLRTVPKLVDYLQSYLADTGSRIREAMSTPSYRMLERAKAWIREHLSEEISLPALAQYLNVHPNYLSARFKTATGETFTEFTTRIRFERAKELLVNPELKIGEIANMVGFTDTNYFSIAFKKHVGVTPTEYRKRYV